MIVEVYESEKEGSITVITQGSTNKAALEKDAVLLRTIEGEDWEDCMTQHYVIMGWAPYVPF